MSTVCVPIVPFYVLTTTMNKVKPNPILEFNENQMQDVRKAVGYEDANRLKQDIEQLQDWIQKQNHFKIKEFDVELMERWLIVNKGSIEKTKQWIDKLCTFTNLLPEFLQNYDIKHEFEAPRKIVQNFVLSKPTKDNYRIFVTYVTGAEDKDSSLYNFYRYLIVIRNYIMHNDYSLGYECICDTRNLTLAMLRKLDPIIVHKATRLFIDGFTVRVKKLHMISGSKWFDIVLSVVKQALSAKLRERIIVHSSYESLQEYFTKEQLPKEFGGDGRSVNEINDAVFKELSTDKHITQMKVIEQLATDESRRLPSQFNEEYSGMPGSFKILCVD